MGRFITTKADFTLRRKHKKGSGVTIYENDYTTINPMPNALKGEYVIGDSNFVFTSRLGINAQKKHSRGKFIPNPSNVTADNGAWTLDNIIDSGISEDTKIRLKPNYTSLKDFALYGSAIKLIQGTVNGIITDFPAELWFSKEEINIYPSNNGVGYSFNEWDEANDEVWDTGVTSTEKLLFNEYGIDILSKNLQPNSVYNPLRFFSLCGSSYTLITVDESGKTTGEYEFTGFEVEDTSLGECYQGKNVEVDKIAVIKMFFTTKVIFINVYKDYTDGAVYYTYVPGDIVDVGVIGDLVQNLPAGTEFVTVHGNLVQANSSSTISVRVLAALAQQNEGGEGIGVSVTLTQQQAVLGAVRSLVFGANPQQQTNPEFEELIGAHIRPKEKLIEEYFRTCDDFTAVLLERSTKPIYKAVFETPKEVETGYSYTMESYIWPSLNGGYNPDLSGPYYTYLESLMNLAEYYDDFFSDNMWRSLTHEAIKTLDWTYTSNKNGEIEELEQIDTSRIEPIVKLYGRQFDDLKRYIDGIKRINTVTYNQKANTPDYHLTDLLEISGWETKTIKLTGNKDLITDSLYPALTSGYTESDASNEFLRRLKLNSRYLFSIKGTRGGLDAMLGLLGFKPNEYDIHEYIYVVSGRSSQYTKFCSDTKNLPVEDLPAFPLAKDVSTINKYKINFNINDPYGEYCGIPVAEVGYFVEDASAPNGFWDYSYVIPWYSQKKKYDDGLYFQMNGGWGNRKRKKIDLGIAPNVKEITETDTVKIYGETQARMRFAKDFDELLQQAYASSKLRDVIYVTDISKIETAYTKGIGEVLSDASHYFVLEDKNLYQFLGYNSASRTYGWRSIRNSEIQTPNSAGTLVLYLESIKDDTTGNNPHVGNGLYDGGASYVESITDIFGYSLINHNFMGIDDKSCDKIRKYTFDKVRQEDNRKCWFFSDDYNTSRGKYGERITLKEVEVTSGRCDDSVFYDPESALGDNGTTNINQDLNIGVDARPHFKEDTVEVYTRGSYASAFNPEPNGAINGEAAANSIVNVKNMVINFNLEAMELSSLSGQMIDYIDEIVIPYLTQMIPSTTILSWSFNGDNGGGSTTRRYLALTPPSSTALNSETIKLTPILHTVVGGVETTSVVGTNAWTSSNPQIMVARGICSTNANEQVTATITATYDGLSASAHVTFVPDTQKVDVEILGLLEQKNDENVFVLVTGALTQNQSISINDEEIYVDGELEQEASTDPEPEAEIFVEGDLVQEDDWPEPEEEIYVEGDLTQEEDPTEVENINVNGTLTQVNGN